MVLMTAMPQRLALINPLCCALTPQLLWAMRPAVRVQVGWRRTACSLRRVGQPRAVAAPSFLFLNANGILRRPVSSAAADACGDRRAASGPAYGPALG